MQRIGFERLAVVFVGDAAEHARSPPIDTHGKKHHGKGSNRGLDLDAAKEQTQRSFVDNPGAGQQEQRRLDERGKILDFAVTVLMVGVGGLIGDPDRKKCQQRSDQIERGMRSFGKNAEAAGAEADHYFERW